MPNIIAKIGSHYEATEVSMGAYRKFVKAAIKYCCSLSSFQDDIINNIINNKKPITEETILDSISKYKERGRD